MAKDTKTTRDKRLYTVAETARFLGLSRQTIYNGLSRKAKKPFPIRPKRIGRKPLFDVRDLDAYVDGL